MALISLQTSEQFKFFFKRPDNRAANVPISNKKGVISQVKPRDAGAAIVLNRQLIANFELRSFNRCGAISI